MPGEVYLHDDQPLGFRAVSRHGVDRSDACGVL